MMSLWFSSVWYPLCPPTHTERNRPSNFEFDGLFLEGAVWVGRTQDKEDDVMHASTSSHDWRARLKPDRPKSDQ